MSRRFSLPFSGDWNGVGWRWAEVEGGGNGGGEESRGVRRMGPEFWAGQPWEVTGYPLPTAQETGLMKLWS